MQHSRYGVRCCLRNGPNWIGSHRAQRGPSGESRGHVGASAQRGTCQRTGLLAAIRLLVEVSIAAAGVTLITAPNADLTLS